MHAQKALLFIVTTIFCHIYMIFALKLEGLSAKRSVSIDFDGATALRGTECWSDPTYVFVHSLARLVSIVNKFMFFCSKHVPVFSVHVTAEKGKTCAWQRRRK